ncbi:MAG: pentapeptide repeat-containing protein [Methylocella sp.]
MSDDSEELDSKAGEPKPPKIKAETNRWYLLSTLYGEPKFGDDEPREKNRVAWNRYFAANLRSETRTRLISEKRYSEEELTPLSSGELVGIARAFGVRSEASKGFALPSTASVIDFSNVEFDQDADFGGYVLVDCTFSEATFAGVAGFENAIFSGRIDFKRTTFADDAGFDGALFAGAAYFNGVTFLHVVEFENATFLGLASFDNATFPEYDDANFRSATFFFATFKHATFFGGAIFAGATFLNYAKFRSATFSDYANFCGATFSQGVNFTDATFLDFADFARATFSAKADFAGVTFSAASDFVNAEMKSETSFESAIFKTSPPKFFGAKLHQGTVWRDVTWPTPKDVHVAGAFIDAYACLKLEMDRLKKHEDELDFFAVELQSRSVLLGTWTGLPIAIYGVVSDYGRSYLRPLVALFYLALIGTLAHLSADSLSPWQSLGLSAANTLNVFGFRKDFFEPTVIAHLPAWLDVVSALQTILGTILLFLCGLGIRNKFRMK